jgi:diacylglycerol kinase (ATP)
MHYSEPAQQVRQPHRSVPFSHPADAEKRAAAPAFLRNPVKVGVLSNMHAGKEGSNVARVLSFLADHPEVTCVETYSSSGVQQALDELARREVGVLVVNGGDGSLQRALTEVLRSQAFERPPVLAPLRCGRTNTSAISIGSSRDPVDAAAAVLAAARQGSLRPSEPVGIAARAFERSRNPGPVMISDRVIDHPVLRVDLSDDPDPHYGMVLGPGVIHRGTELTHRAFPTAGTQGVIGASLVTGSLIVRALLGGDDGIMTPDRASLTLDGVRQKAGEYLVMLASTLDRMFLRIKPYWDARPGAIHFTAITKPSIRRPADVLRVLSGREPSASALAAGALSRNVETAELSIDCGMMLDGEILDPKPGRSVRISAEHSVKFLMS